MAQAAVGRKCEQLAAARPPEHYGPASAVYDTALLWCLTMHLRAGPGGAATQRGECVALQHLCRFCPSVKDGCMLQLPGNLRAGYALGLDLKHELPCRSLAPS